MFTDGRSKRVVFLAHCLLNQNAISDGTAVYPAAFNDVIDLFLTNEIGIVQMPCPEFTCLGLDRGNPDGAFDPVVKENTRIRKEMQRTAVYNQLQVLTDQVVSQILEYTKHGFQVVGIIGANRSPNCGVDTTSDHNEEIPGQGLFMAAIAEKLKQNNCSVPMVGLKCGEDYLSKLQDLVASSSI